MYDMSSSFYEAPILFYDYIISSRNHDYEQNEYGKNIIFET